MGAAVQSGTACEKTVSVADLYDVFICPAGGYECPGAAFFPEIHIMLGIKRDDAAAGRSGSGLDPYTVLKRFSQKPVGICVTQIIFCKERQEMQVFDPVYVFRPDSGFVHLFPVVRDVVIYTFHCLYESFTLPCDHLLSRCAFMLPVVIPFHFHFDFCLLSD